MNKSSIMLLMLLIVISIAGCQNTSDMNTPLPNQPTESFNLEIQSPLDKAEFGTSSVRVTGTISDNTADVMVYNSGTGSKNRTGIKAEVTDSGQFYTDIKLAKGSNIIDVIATTETAEISRAITVYFNPPPFTNAVSEPSANVSPYIVQIIFGASDNDWQSLTFTSAIGNGLLVNKDGYVITASHVLDLGEQYIQKIDGSSNKLRIIVPAYKELGWSNQEPRHTANDFDIIARDELHGLALLKIKMQVGPVPGVGGTMNAAIYSVGVTSNLNIKPIPLNYSHKLKIDDTIAVSGYPTAQGVLGHALRWADLVTCSGSITFAELMKIEDVHLGVGEVTVSENISDCYRTDIKLEAGNSGGPVYLASDSAIVGMGISTEEGALMVPSRYIADLLNANDIEWMKAN